MAPELKVKRFVTEIGAFTRVHRAEGGDAGDGSGGGGGELAEWSCLPALRSTSSRGSGRSVSLGTHLMGTFKLLEEQGCDEDVCMAGGLHSIYGTNQFKSISLQANDENRQRVRVIFGDKAERLIFLFHVSNRPAGLERGELRDRYNRNIAIPVTAWELHELRLVEAANLLDQYTGSMKERLKHLASTFPVLSACWLSQLRVHKLHLACARVADDKQNDENSSRWYTRWLQAARPRERKRYLLLSIHPHEMSSSLYAFTALHAAFDVDVRIHEDGAVTVLAIDQLEKRLRKVFAAPRHSRYVYVLHGESAWGMPWSPLSSLSQFLRCRCAAADATSSHHLALDVCLAPSLPPLPSLPPPTSPAVSLADLTAYSTAARALLADLRSRGFGVVRLTPSQVQCVRRAYAAMRALTQLSHAPLEERAARGLRMCTTHFGGDRYVGFSQDRGRAWVQLREVLGESSGRTAASRRRQVVQDAARSPSQRDARLYWMQFASLAAEEPESAGQGDDNGEAVSRVPSPAQATVAELLTDLLRCTLQLQQAARSLLLVLGETMGLPLTDLQALLHDPGSDGDEEEGGRAGFGASVHRVYEYKPGSESHEAGASGLHADMGLLTLAPRSTRPALSVFRPGDLHTQSPEHSLSSDDEAVVFIGEILAFLTGGWLPAALHSVPPTSSSFHPDDASSSLLPRLSMPFFLRPHPATRLTPYRPETLESFWNTARKPTPLPSSASSNEAVPVRVFLERHALALRPWRLGTTSADY